MDPHKPSLNQPPPAHNMSGPPQHPPPPSPHGMPMGSQPLAPRTMQPSYMLPRPAHTGSPVSMPSKAAQPSLSGPKASQQPGGSSSPKPQVPQNPSQEKPAMPESSKLVTPPASNTPVTVAGMAKSANMPSLVQAGGTKPVHNMNQQQQPQQTYHQMNEMHHQHQQRPGPHVQQPLINQQQMNVSHQQMQMNQQQQQQPSLPNQQLPSTAIQQHNQNLQGKVSVQNSAKQENPKGPTPPVPDLISISKPPAHTHIATSSGLNQPHVATSSGPAQPHSATSASLNQNPTTSTKPFPSHGSNPTVKPAQNSGATNQSSSVQGYANNPYQVTSSKQQEQNKSPNISITPAKPASNIAKPETSKVSGEHNTVTITPSMKSSENVDSRVNDSTRKPAESVPQNVSETNLNGVGAKNPKPHCLPSKPIDQITSELKASTTAAPAAENAKAFAPPAVQITASAPKIYQQPVQVPKQSPPQNISKPPNFNQNMPVKPPLPVSPQKHNYGANVGQSPNQFNPPKTSPFNNSPSQKLQPVQPLAPIQHNVAAAKPTVNASAVSTISVTQKLGQTLLPVEKPKEALGPATRHPVVASKQPRSRRTVTRAPANMDDEDSSSHNEDDDDEMPKRRATRAKRKVSETPSEGERKSRRSRNPAPIYQSPVQDVIPRITNTPKAPQEKLVLFFKNEHVALRNAEGTFYLCQIAQNVYKQTKKIRIRWLSPTDETNEACDTFKADYFDITDFDCILTSIVLQKAEKGIMRLPAEERKRILNILQRSLDRDRGISPDKGELDADHPDGLDLSLYNDESQLKKEKQKGGRRKKKRSEDTSDESDYKSDEDKDMEEENVEEQKEEVVEEPPSKVVRTSPADGKKSARAVATPRPNRGGKKSEAETTTVETTSRRVLPRGSTRSRSSATTNSQEQPKDAPQQHEPPPMVSRAQRSAAKPTAAATHPPPPPASKMGHRTRK